MGEVKSKKDWEARVRAELIAKSCDSEAAIRADERNKVAEEIARRLIEEECDYSADIARSFITKPKSREQVMEEALREIRDDVYGPGAIDPKMVARRALERKP